MSERRNPELFQFFGGNFHQDWDLESPTPDGIIDTFVGSHPRDECHHLANLIDAYAAMNPDDEVLNDALYKELGCDYAPEADNLSAREWLRHVSSRLRAVS